MHVSYTSAEAELVKAEPYNI